MIKVNELFAGIGAFRNALIKTNIPHSVVGISEIDKFAIKSYEAIYGNTKNYGDISKVDKLDYADLWTYGFPCQDISVAGKQEGIKKGKTRSGLLYEVERLLEKSRECGELPKYLMLENVKNLVGKKFKAQFDEWIQRLDELGFNTYWQVLNAKNYGVPQNRERVFAISIRKDIDTGYVFPEPFELKIRLKDVLEKEVDEEFYLDNAKTSYVLEPKTRFGRMGRQAVETFNEKQPSFGSTINPFNKTVDTSDKCPTITTRPEGFKTAILLVTQNHRIRKLTPKECWRLMGFTDEQFQKAEEVNSNSQLCKQAGNSIVVTVLEALMTQLLGNEHGKLGSGRGCEL